MVTDEIMEAVEMVIGTFSTEEERRAGNIIMEMLGELNEDVWVCMTDSEKAKWIDGYIDSSK